MDLNALMNASVVDGLLNHAAEAFQDAPAVVPGGEDTCHLSYYCSFSPTFHRLWPMMLAAQRVAQSPREAASPEDEPPQPVFSRDGRDYVVSPGGFGAGDAGDRFGYFPFVMKDGGIVIGLQPRPCKPEVPGEKRQNPNVRVEIGAMPLLVAGSLDVLMPDIEARLAALGLVVLKNRLARVDVCVDVPVSVSGLQHAVLDRRFKTRARTTSAYVLYDDDGENRAEILPSSFPDEDGMIALHFKGYACTGFSVGKDKIMCRGYDKLEKEKRREDMLEALRLRRFGASAELPASLTRVEFQLRREALRGMAVVGETSGIETWQDWCRHKASVVRYLCTEWLVFTEKSFCRAHSDRITLDDYHTDWLKVVRAFKRAFGDSGRKAVRLESSIRREGRDAIAQAIGNDQSAMLKVGLDLSPTDPDWIEHVARFRYFATRHFLADPDKASAFWDNWRDKELRQEASLPMEAFSSVLPSAVVSRGAGVTHDQPLTEPLCTPTTASGSLDRSPDAVV